VLAVKVSGLILMKILHKVNFYLNVYLAITHLYAWLPRAQEKHQHH